MQRSKANSERGFWPWAQREWRDHYHHVIALLVVGSGGVCSLWAEDWPLAVAAFLGAAAVIWGSRSIENAATRVTETINEGLALARGDKPLAVPDAHSTETTLGEEATDNDGPTEDGTESALLVLMQEEFAVAAMSGLHTFASAAFDRQTRVTPDRAAQIANSILDHNHELMQQLRDIAEKAPHDYWDESMSAYRQGASVYSGSVGTWRGVDHDRPLTPEPETPTALAWRLFRQQEQTVQMLRAVSEGDLGLLELPQNHLGLEAIERRRAADDARDRVDHATCEYLLRLGQVLGVGLEPQTVARRDSGTQRP